MTLKSMLQDNIKDYYHGCYVNEVNKLSEEEQKELHSIINDIKILLETESKKGNYSVTFILRESNKKYINQISLWAKSECIKYEFGHFSLTEFAFMFDLTV